MTPTLRAAIIAQARAYHAYKRPRPAHASGKHYGDSLAAWVAMLDAAGVVKTELEKIATSEAERNVWYARIHRITWPDNYYR